MRAKNEPNLKLVNEQCSYAPKEHMAQWSLGQLPKGRWFKLICDHLMFCVESLDKALYICIVTVHPATNGYQLILGVNLW